ncbi:hypothetical protein GCM10010349_42040 [Streptomyces flavofungini]|nr:hypothetical protein GCM10010349_42040 [Streptomyces flavofungini]
MTDARAAPGVRRRRHAHAGSYVLMQGDGREYARGRARVMRPNGMRMTGTLAQNPRLPCHLPRPTMAATDHGTGESGEVHVLP